MTTGFQPPANAPAAINYAPDLAGIEEAKGGNDLRGGEYLVTLTKSDEGKNAEWYDNSAFNSGTCMSIYVKIHEAGPGSKGQVGAQHPVKIKGFGLTNPMEPKKGKDYRAKQQLAAVLSAVYKVDHATVLANTAQYLAHFMSGQADGAPFRITAVDKIARDSKFPYTKYNFAAYTPTAG